MDETTADPRGQSPGGLTEAGVSVWLAGAPSSGLRSGALEGLVAEGVVGLTISARDVLTAVAGGAHRDRLAALASDGVDAEAAAVTLMCEDARAACDVLRSVFDAGGGRDGRVAVEIDLRLARDTDATIEAARRLWLLIERPNLLVTIPATSQALPAIAEAIAEGISVNATLVPSLDRYRAVALAYLDGLERAHLAGAPLAPIASHATLPLPELDAAADARLREVGTTEANGLCGRLAAAHAHLAYRAYEEIFSTPRWQELADAGARPQRLSWAPPGPAVSPADRPDELHAALLAAPDVVLLLTEAALRATQEHRPVGGPAIRAQYAAAQAVLDDVERLGVSYSELTDAVAKESRTAAEAAWSTLVARAGEALTG